MKSKSSDIGKRLDTDSSDDIPLNERSGVFGYEKSNGIPEEYDPSKSDCVSIRDFVVEGGRESNLEPQNDSYDVGGGGSEFVSVSKNDPYDAVANEGTGMKEEFGRTMFSCINGNGTLSISLADPRLHLLSLSDTAALGLGNRTDGPLIGGGSGVTLRQDSGSFGAGIELAALA